MSAQQVTWVIIVNISTNARLIRVLPGNVKTELTATRVMTVCQTHAYTLARASIWLMATAVRVALVTQACIVRMTSRNATLTLMSASTMSSVKTRLGATSVSVSLVTPDASVKPMLTNACHAPVKMEELVVIL